MGDLSFTAWHCKASHGGAKQAKARKNQIDNKQPVEIDNRIAR